MLFRAVYPVVLVLENIKHARRVGTTYNVQHTTVEGCFRQGRVTDVSGHMKAGPTIVRHTTIWCGVVASMDCWRWRSVVWLRKGRDLWRETFEERSEKVGRQHGVTGHHRYLLIRCYGAPSRRRCEFWSVCTSRMVLGCYSTTM